MPVAATTVKKPSENSPIKWANRRRCERKQTPKNRVIATKGKSWEKTVEDTCLLCIVPMMQIMTELRGRFIMSLEISTDPGGSYAKPMRGDCYL